MKTYQIPVSNTWWLKKKSYFFFVIREMTSLFVAGYCLFLLVFISKAAESQQAYTELLVSLKSPVSILLHLIFLAFILYHAITWFNLTPKIIVLHIGEEKIPDGLIAVSIYIGWLAVSLIILWIIFGG